jgi:hypothetical protein
MLAIELRNYLSILIDKTDDAENLDVIVNGLEINKIEYVKGFDSNNINEEIIEITAK